MALRNSADWCLKIEKRYDMTPNGQRILDNLDAYDESPLKAPTQLNGALRNLMGLKSGINLMCGYRVNPATLL